MDFRRSQVPPERYFAGLVEYVFQTRLGLVDPPLTDYVSRLVQRFLHTDAIHAVRNPTGRRLDDVGQMVVEAEQRRGDARREVLRHVGDFALFWTGLFPESLRRRAGRQRLDFVEDYTAQGKRSYLLASAIEPSEQRAPEGALLARLSYEFELCAFGLHELRREWEPPPGETPPADETA